MGFIKNHKIFAFTAVFIGILFFASRLLFLTQLPIFTDEAIYLRWAQIALNDKNWLLISLTDGKQPLFIWFVMLAMSIFKDPLFTGRIVSVFAGLFSMIGIYFLGKELFKSSRIGFFSALIYLIYPFALVYDRMALYDSLVGTFAIWGLFFAIRFIRSQNLKSSLALGILSGIASINKSNGFFTIILLPFTLLLFDWSKNKLINRLLKLIVLGGVSALIMYGIYSLLRISPFFYIVDQKNAVFIYPISEWITHPFLSVVGNLRALSVWFYEYTTIPLLFLMIIAFLIDKKFLKEKLMLFFWFAGPFIVLAFFGRVIYPRYILFMTLPLLLLVGYSLDILLRLIKNKYFFVGLALLIFIMPLVSDFYILTDFSKSSAPFTDRYQYRLGWPAGVGIKESVDFFNKEAEMGPIFIGTEGTFGLLPKSYEIYLGRNPNIEIKGYWPIDNQPPNDLNNLKNKKNIYFVFYQPCSSCKNIGDAPPTWNLKKVASYKKGEANLTIYKF